MTDRSLRDVRTSHEEHLPILGVATTFATNSAEVLGAIRDGYGGWARLPEEIVTQSATVVRVVVDEAVGGGEAGPPPAYRIPDPGRLVVITDGGVGVADTGRAESVAYVSPSLVARRPTFFEEVLEPLTLFLLGVQDREPLHAAAVVRHGVAVLLAGPSGAGKSTLAHASRRSGFSVLADEPVYVQTRPTLRVWGRRSRLHLPAAAKEHFPDLSGLEPVSLPNGKMKIVVPGGGSEPRYADRMGICLLRRGQGSRASLEPLSASQVVDELTSHLDPGFDLFADSIGDRIARIAERGAWAMTWSGGPHEAVPLLDRVASVLGAE